MGRQIPVGRLQSPKTVETFRTVIGLAKDSITATHRGAPTIAYQFPLKRMYVLDLQEKTYADLSLFSTLASRVNGLIRRRTTTGTVGGDGNQR